MSRLTWHSSPVIREFIELMPHQPSNIDAIMTAFGRALERRPYGKSAGGWQLTAVRVLTGWGIPEPGTYDPLTITPREYFANAAQCRITVYQRIKSLGDCLACLQAGFVFSASLEITRQWEKNKEHILLDVLGDEYIGCHCLTIVGVDRDTRTLLGDDMLPLERGAARLQRRIPFEFFERNLVEAYLCQYNTVPAATEYEDDQNKIEFRVYRSGLIFEGEALGFHLYNKKSDEVFAWAMATLTQGVLNVEDFFVRPDYRRRKFGGHLLARINEAAINLNASLCFWIPWANHKIEDRLGFNALAAKCGWNFAPSGQRWAAYKCGPNVAWSKDLKLTWIPERAGLVSPLPIESIALLSGEWTDEKNEKRLELIDRKYSGGLSPTDETLFALLQAQLGEYQNRIAPLPFDSFQQFDPPDPSE